MNMLFADLTYQPPPVTEPPGFAYLLVRLFLLTGFVLSICVGLLWASRKFRRGTAPGTQSGDMVYVATAALNARCALHLMKVGGQSVVVGTDLTGIKATLVLPDSFERALEAVGSGSGRVIQ